MRVNHEIVKAYSSKDHRRIGYYIKEFWPNYQFTWLIGTEELEIPGFCLAVLLEGRPPEEFHPPSQFQIKAIRSIKKAEEILARRKETLKAYKKRAGVLQLGKEKE